MMFRFLYVVLALTLGVVACPFPGYAQEKHVPEAAADKVIRQNFRLYYRHSETTIDPTYLDNTLQMDTIVRYLARSPRIDSITVYAYASPEGSFKGNKRLATRRAEVARDFILANLAPGAQIPEIILKPVPEHWEGLYEEVLKNYHLYDREKVLKILEDNSVGTETKKWRLQQLNNKRTWHHLIGKHMPELRVATWICIWVPPMDIEECEPIIAPLPEAPCKGIAPLPEPVKEAGSYTPALKTNLLYDAATALNASVEFPIGKKFSVMVEDVFPWWSWGPNKNKYCFQLWEMGVEPRWWFKSNGNLQGHFVGLYGKSAKYDLQNDASFCYQGEYWSAGLSYGYAMPLGKHLQMEFSLSVGYLQSDYRHYQPGVDYDHLYIDRSDMGTFSYFGPTKLAVKLVLPIKFQSKRNG